MKTKINLSQDFFSANRKSLIENSSFSVIAFRYKTGVAALEIYNNVGSFIILPFNGQQIYKINFHNQDLTMKSIFDEPNDSMNFGENYGSHLIHCGLTKNGNPSEEEDYPLHGELPNCKYQDAYILVDDFSITVGGNFYYKNSLEYNYVFNPEISLNYNSSILDVNIFVENLRSKPMKYMYMAHINWIPVDGSELIYSSNKGEDDITVFDDTFGLPESEESDKFKAYVKELKINPLLSDVLDSHTQIYDPEFCMYIKYLGDEVNYAHALQVMPNGYSQYVKFNRETLPSAVRWIARTGDEDAIGFAIPSMTNHLGFARNDKLGLIPEISAKSKINLNYSFGLLNPMETEEMKEKIDRIISKK